jgi:hypothetical protein
VEGVRCWHDMGFCVSNSSAVGGLFVLLLQQPRCLCMWPSELAGRVLCLSWCMMASVWGCGLCGNGLCSMLSVCRVVLAET